MIYYTVITDFNVAEDKKIISDKKAVNVANAVFIAVLIICALLCAATAGAPETGFTLLYAFILFGITLLGFIALHIFFYPAHTRKLNGLIARKICAAFDGADILSGEDVELTVDYDEGILTVARKGFLRKITISPNRGGEIPTGGGSVKFDLSGLKKLPAVYSSFGTRILQYLQAYFYLHSGCERATVYDGTGDGQAEEIYLVTDGRPTADIKRNYFIKTGILK